MKTALRFSTSLASALLVFSCAAAASAEDWGLPPVEEPDPRTHILSAHLVSTPLYLGYAYVGNREDGWIATSPILVGVVGEYQYSFGLVRLGVGLQYTHTWESRRDYSYYGNGEESHETFAYELGIPVRLSFGGTTSNGIDIAGTLGGGYGRAWVQDFDGTTYANAGPFFELLASVAVPVSQSVDVSFRGGLNVGVFSGEGESLLLKMRHIRAFNNFEVGLRKRF
jgi:hypothetical protein